jgi:hypothetical protein
MDMNPKPRSSYLVNVMRQAAAGLCILAAVCCMTVFASPQDKQTSNKQRQTLTVSKDGKYLLDTTGKKVEQYLESAKAFVPMTAKDKNGVEFDPANPSKSIKSNSDCNPHPCRCRDECIRWDENGKCNGTARHCDICC